MRYLYYLYTLHSICRIERERGEREGVCVIEREREIHRKRREKDIY